MLIIFIALSLISSINAKAGHLQPELITGCADVQVITSDFQNCKAFSYKNGISVSSMMDSNVNVECSGYNYTANSLWINQQICVFHNDANTRKRDNSCAGKFSFAGEGCQTIVNWYYEDGLKNIQMLENLNQDHGMSCTNDVASFKGTPPRQLCVIPPSSFDSTTSTNPPSGGSNSLAPNATIITPTPTPSTSPEENKPSLKEDWIECSHNEECKIGCCSNIYSNDGAMKCTPGGCWRAALKAQEQSKQQQAPSPDQNQQPAQQQAPSPDQNQQPAPRPNPAPSGLNSEEQAALDAHNAERSRQGQPSLSWSSSLTSSAESYARILAAGGCHLVHSGWAGLGENLYAMWGGNPSLKNAVDAFVAEGYHGSLNHYTQVVWHSTSQVGCAGAYGNNCRAVVCHYNPRGNWIGEDPFTN